VGKVGWGPKETKRYCLVALFMPQIALLNALIPPV